MHRPSPGRTRGPAAVGLVLATVVALCLSIAPAASAGGDRSSTGGGSRQQLGALAGAWWQYALGQNFTTGPLTDPTGAGCRKGQGGPVFYLVGTTESGPVTRSCTVPRGRSLFFPMINLLTLHLDGDAESPEDLWKQLQGESGFAVTRLYAEVDGRTLVSTARPDPAHRGCVGPDRACAGRSFTVRLPADNPWGAAAGRYGPAVTDGYWVLVPPLPPGRHTIHFGGATDFTQDITYVLTVR